MPSTQISASIDLSQPTAHFKMSVASFLGYSFDMIASFGANASGKLEIFCQNVDPDLSTATYAPKLSYLLTSGQFQGNATAQTIDSAYLTSSQFFDVVWTRSSGSGTLNIVGFAKSFT